MSDQKEFISWLSKKFKTKSEKELAKKLEEIGEEGIKSEYKKFKSERNDSFKEQENSSTSIPMSEQGGKLDYLKCLELFKKGGKMKSCGCGSKMKQEKGGIMKKGKESPMPNPLSKKMEEKGGKMKMEYGNRFPMSAKNGAKIPKAFLGALLGATKAASTVGTIAKTANTVSKIGKVADTATKVAGAIKPLFASKQTMQVGTYPQNYQVGTVNPNEIPGGVTAQNPTKQGNFTERSIPMVKMEDGGEVEKKISKLDKLKALKKAKKK